MRTPSALKLLSQSNQRSTGLPSGVLWPVGLLSLGTLLAEHGFEFKPATTPWFHLAEAILAGFYLAERVLLLVRGPNLWAVVRQFRFEYGVLAFFGVLALASAVSSAAASNLTRFFHLDNVWDLRFHIIKLFLVANVLTQLLRLQQRLLFRGLRPEWMLAGSFGMLIVAGTLLLSLPRVSARPDKPIGLLDAFFTATSASCVVGLGVRDTGTDFTPFGQGILLVLVQTGGLGIMTFVAFLAITSAESLPIPQMLAFRKMVGARTPATLRRQVWAILGMTGLVELAGAACLYSSLPAEQDRLTRAGWSLFHSVMAFCNAGFSLPADSLAAFRNRPLAMLTFMALIILGGLGFLVITDLLGLRVSRLPLIRSIPWVRRYNERVPVYRVPVQTRLSVLMTGLLLLFGWAGFWMLEGGHILAGESFSTQFWVSAFESITCRSCGFTTVPTDQLQPATLLMMMALMAVGACPISTGGGIKTVTLAVLLLALRALMTGRERVEIYGRALPQRVLLTALAVAVLFVLASGLGVFGLSLCDPKIPLRAQMFEVVSALSTTGLSTGVLSQLSPGSQLILCVLMFIGRVGPLSLFLVVARIRPPPRYQFPEEDMVVG